MTAIGHIDALTTSGYLEGWAHDPERLGQVLELCVLLDRREIGRGLANRFRRDLAEAGCGLGWCAFRIRLDGTVSALRRATLSLNEPGIADAICTTDRVRVHEETEPEPSTVSEVTQTDLTALGSVDQLRSCDPLFECYVARHGPETFVRAAYVYILGRPADVSGLLTYSELLKSAELTPHGILNALHDSDEFRAAPRLLSAPTEPGFVFAAP